MSGRYGHATDSKSLERAAWACRAESPGIGQGGLPAFTPRTGTNMWIIVVFETRRVSAAELSQSSDNSIYFQPNFSAD
eukprot:5986660-Pyramimonas_sp.AAC.1